MPLLAQAAGAGAAAINMTSVERLDTFGAWLLERLVRDITTAGRGVDVVGLPARYDDLVQDAQPGQSQAARAAAGGSGRQRRQDPAPRARR